MDRPPSDPCTAPAGSAERVQAYRRRAEAGLPIFNDDDAPEVQHKEPRQGDTCGYDLPPIRTLSIKELRNA